MYYLTAADVVIVLRTTGTPAEVRDFGLLESALARPQASAFGEDAYPDPWEKAAALMHSIVRSYPFVDGNKRAGWNAAWTFLEFNEIAVLDAAFDIDDAERLVLGIAAGEIEDLTELATRLQTYAQR